MCCVEMFMREQLSTRGDKFYHAKEYISIGTQKNIANDCPIVKLISFVLTPGLTTVLTCNQQSGIFLQESSL